MHDFFGNKTTNAYSTQASMLAGATTCRIPSDTAGYWSPKASLRGVTIKPRVMRIYYLGVKDVAVETIPQGLKFIGGNKDALSAADNPHVSWYCGASGSVKTPMMDAPYDCRPWAQFRFVDGVVGVVDMPNCWDGVGLGPSDVVYAVAGSCPPGFDHVLARVSQRIHFGVMNPLNSIGPSASRSRAALTTPCIRTSGTPGSSPGWISSSSGPTTSTPVRRSPRTRRPPTWPGRPTGPSRELSTGATGTRS